MSPFQKWILFFALTVLAVLISYQWLDRPISYFAHHELRQSLFRTLTLLPEWAQRIAVVAFMVLAIRALLGHPLSKLEAVILLCSLSMVAAWAIKNDLKFVFGRTWPETWINNNPSLIRDGVYGFNLFRGVTGYDAFPSGHTTAICALMAVWWNCYPRWRALYVAGAAAVAIGLVGANYHFLSDVIAGVFLGVTAGWVAVLMWDAGGYPRVSAKAGHSGMGGLDRDPQSRLDAASTAREGDVMTPPRGTT